MPAGNTYEAIATTTASGSVSFVTFSSIPQTYTDLVLVYAGTGASLTYSAIRFNSDTGTNYSYTVLAGNGSATFSGRSTNVDEIYTSRQSTVSTSQNNTIAHIQNYSNTTTFKTVLMRSNDSTVEASAAVGLWRNTAAITSVTFKLNNINFTAGSTVSLYGIASA